MASSYQDLNADLIDKAEGSGYPNRGGRSNRGADRRGRGGRGGSGRASIGRDVLISKALSRLLRHQADAEGLKLDREGFAKLDEVLNWNHLKSLNATFTDIQNVVADNSKQRFSMKVNPAISPLPASTSTDPSHWLVRANQGHSIAIDSAGLLKPITLEAGNIPNTVVHGTYYAFFHQIVESGGLKKMGRNHVHFSTGLPEDKQGVISGMRSDAEILIYIDIQKCLEDGDMLWWMSENGVVLTEGDENGLVPTKYWKKVEGRRGDVGLLWLDGMQVADLPPGLRGRRAPSGKGNVGKR